MSWEQSRMISYLIVDAITIAIIIVTIVLIVRAIKRHSDRKYELEKYKAETERMGAEAEAKKNYDPER